MKFEQFDLVKIHTNGFAILNLQLSKKMKNVKPEYEGIRESFNRSLIGFFLTEKRIMICFLFFAKEIKFELGKN